MDTLFKSGIIWTAFLSFSVAPLMTSQNQCWAGDNDPALIKSDDQDEKANLLYMKGRDLVLNGKYEQAAPLLEEALKSDASNPFVHHQLAEVYFHSGQFDKAEQFAKKAVEMDGKNLEYRMTLGGIYAALKRYPEAKTQYEKITELDPTNQKSPLLQAIVESEAGQNDSAIKVISKFVDQNPDNYMALFYRAKIYLDAEEVKKAKADLDRCITLAPSFVEAGSALGLIHERLGEIDEAIKVYGRMQGNGRFRKRLAQLYLQKSEFEKALLELNEYEKLEPDDYTARVKIGLILFEQKKYEPAADKFKAILKEQPDSDNVRFYLGAVYEEMKREEAAIAEFRRIGKDSTFYRESMLHVGFLFRQQGKLKEGSDLARKLVSQSPEFPEFFDMQASFFELQRDYKRALATLSDGLKKHPTDEKLLYFQAALHDKTGEKKKATASMEHLLEINPNSAHALNFLGYTYAEEGVKLEEAEKMVRKAMTLRPTDGFIVDSLGWVLFKQGKTDEAIAELQHAAEMQPDEAVILEHLGDAYLKKKEYAKASDYYRKAAASAKKDKDHFKKIESKIAALEKEKRIPTGEASN